MTFKQQRGTCISHDIILSIAPHWIWRPSVWYEVLTVSNNPISWYIENPDTPYYDDQTVKITYRPSPSHSGEPGKQYGWCNMHKSVSMLFFFYFPGPLYANQGTEIRNGLCEDVLKSQPNGAISLHLLQQNECYHICLQHCIILWRMVGSLISFSLKVRKM